MFTRKNLIVAAAVVAALGVKLTGRGSSSVRLPVVSTMPDGIELFNPPKMRNMVFETLAHRLGEDNAAVMKDDFLGHIAEDPKDGVEVAYLCLLGKMIDLIDRINDQGHAHDDGPISPFLTFRKDG